MPGLPDSGRACYPRTFIRRSRLRAVHRCATCEPVATTNSCERAMKWNAAEVELGSAIVAALTSVSIPRTALCQKRELGMFRKDADDLVKDIPQRADGQLVLGVVPVRHLFRLFGFDEHHPFQWRLEHKLVQALILEHFCPGAMPATRGLVRYILEHPDRTNKGKL